MSENAEKPPMIVRVFDVETAGYSPALPGDLLEIGWCDAVFNNGQFLILPPISILVRPDRPITVEGQSVHHIDPSDLVHALSREDALNYVRALPPAVANVAHNASYELGVLPETASQKWVCTYKCGVRLYPDAPRHTNQFLRYHFGLQVDRGLAQPPHRAGPDAFVTAHIVVKMIADFGIKKLLEVSADPLLLPRINFSDHRGKSWSDPSVPTSFLSWVMGKDNFSADIKYACQSELDRRKSATATAPGVKSQNVWPVSGVGNETRGPTESALRSSAAPSGIFV